MYKRLQVKYLLFVSDFVFSTEFRKISIKLHENLPSGSRFVPRGRTDGHTDRLTERHDEANRHIWHKNSLLENAYLKLDANTRIKTKCYSYWMLQETRGIRKFLDWRANTLIILPLEGGGMFGVALNYGISQSFLCVFTVVVFLHRYTV